MLIPGSNVMYNDSPKRLMWDEDVKEILWKVYYRYRLPRFYEIARGLFFMH